MTKSAYIIWMVAMAFVTLQLLPYAIEIFGIIFLKKGVSIMTQLSLFKWCAVGFVGYCIFHKYVHLNIKWLETDSHEKIHVVSFFPQTQNEGVLYPVVRMITAMWKTLIGCLDVMF